MLLDTYKIILGRLDRPQAPTETPNDFYENLEKNQKNLKISNFSIFFVETKLIFLPPNRLKNFFNGFKNFAEV